MKATHENLSAKPKRVVLFDLEGTLVDFQWDLDRAVGEVTRVLYRLGFDPSSWESHYAVLRNTALRLAAKRGLDRRHVAKSIDAVYDRYDFDAASRWTLKPEVMTLLPFLKEEKRVALGLVTNVGRRGVECAFTALGLTGVFDVVVTRNDVELIKPSGQGIQLALRRLGAANADALFVGDSTSDILASHEAEVCVAIVQGGESAPASLTALGPDHYWQSLAQLRALYAGGELTD